MPNIPKTSGLQYLCNKYVKENMKKEIDFLPADKHLCVCVMCMSKHAHITQNNKSPIFLQYLKKEVISDAIDFLHAYKHESLLQIGTMILMETVNYSQNSQSC